MAALSSRYAYEGTETTEVAITRVGSPADPTGQVQSRKIVTSANAQWLRPFRAEPYVIWNPTAGANVDVTVYGIINGVLPLNDELFMEVEYLTLSGAAPLGKIVTTTKANVLAAPAAVAADASVWNGVPASGDPYSSSVKLLMGFEGADASTGAPGMADESIVLRGAATVVGNAQIDTAQSKHGTSSLLLDGNGDYLTYPDSADWAFGAGPFTIECWVRYNNVTDAEFISQWDNSATIAGWKFGRTATWGLVFDFYDPTSTLQECLKAWTPVANTWYHVAVDRDASNVVRIYVDGVMLNKATIAQACRDCTKELSIGRIDHGTPRYLDGWIDDVRITKGVARYGSDSGFVPPGPWVPFKLTTTLNAPQPGLAGYIDVRVRAAKPNTTFYIDPTVILTPAAGGTTNVSTAYKSARYTYEGTETTEVAITRVDGAADPTGRAQSRKIVTSANAQWLRPFKAEPYAIWNAANGINVTVTLCGIVNSSALPLNDELFMEVEYLTLSSQPSSTRLDGAKTGTIVVSNGGLTATHNDNANSVGVASTTFLGTGKYYYEGTVQVTRDSFLNSIGLMATTGAPGDTRTGANAASILMGNSSYVYVDTVAKTGNLGNTAIGDVYGVAVDLTNRLFWARRNAGDWNADAAANPATGVNGIAFGVVGGGYAPCVGFSGAGATDTITLNFGASSYVRTPPSGFAGWTAPPAPLGKVVTTTKANVLAAPAAVAADGSTWNNLGAISSFATFDGVPTNTTLSNGNLTVTRTSSGVTAAGARGALLMGAGKFYFEVKVTAAHAWGDIVGVLLSTASYTNHMNLVNSSSVCVGEGASNNGSIFANGSSTTYGLGTIANGDTISVAVDFNARLAWFRKNGGSWNGNSAANPATLVNGVVIGVGTYSPAVTFGSSGSVAGDAMTANFGATAYTYTPPSGFGNWGNFWTPFKLTTTLNSPQPGVAGYIHTRVRAGLPSATYYIDPKITLS